MDVLSSAVTAYLGWKVATMPTADDAAVAEVARDQGVEPGVLGDKVRAAIADSDAVAIADVSGHSDGGAAEYKSRLRRARPDLSADAVDALASRRFYRARWLGIDTTPDTARYFVRYGGDGATPISIALFRRRTVDGAVVDESLRDVGVWKDDTRHVVDRALAFPLDSDLEEVDAAQAHEFEEMVASGRYTPFRHGAR